MHLNRSTSALAIFSLLSLASSLPFNFLEPLVRRATYSVVPVDGGSASTGGAGQGDATIYETIIVTAAPATETLVDTIAITDYIVSTEIVQLSGTVQTVLVTVTPPAATVTTTGYSIIDVSASQVTITTTAFPSSSSSSKLSAASVSTTLSPSTPSATTYSSLKSSSHTYDDGQWHTYYPSWNASTTSIVPRSPTTTSIAATLTQPSLEIPPPLGPGGGYGDFGKRAAPTVIPGVYGYIGKWERLLRKRVANLV